MHIKNIKYWFVVTAVALSGLASAQQAYAEADYQTRIVGGTESSQNQWPWMVLLSGTNSTAGFFCGASLISEQWVLTAAHCVVDKSLAEVKAFVGEYDLTTADIAATGISSIIVHPDYNADTSDNDIALLKLDTPATGATTLQFVDSSTATLLNPGDNVSVIGWGGVVAQPGSNISSLPSLTQSYPDILRDVSMPYISNTDCNATMNGQVTDNMMCAGVPQGGVDSCQGDSGGPLVFSNDNGASWIQAGIVSWGYGCADVNNYGVYTRVENYSDWVALNTSGISIEPVAKMGTWIPGLSTSYDLVIENAATNSAFDITTVNLTGAAFTITADSCSASTIAAGASCTITFGFNAGVVGDSSETISINTTGTSLSNPLITIPVTAAVVDPVVFSNVQADSAIQWALAGTQGWTEQQVTTDGAYSLQSGNITHNQDSSLFAYVNVAGSARDVYFDWKACSEYTWDFLELWVDNEKIDARSGDAGWAHKMVSLSGAGDHVIEWRYNKDYIEDYGADAGWIANIALDAASTNPLPQHNSSCGPVIVPEPTPAPASSSGGAAISAWTYLILAMPLLMRRRRYSRA